MDRMWIGKVNITRCSIFHGCLEMTGLLWMFPQTAILRKLRRPLKVRIGDWILWVCVAVCFLSASLAACCVNFRYLKTLAGYQVVSSDIHGCHGPNKTYSLNQSAFGFHVSNFLPVQVCIFQVANMI